MGGKALALRSIAWKSSASPTPLYGPAVAILIAPIKFEAAMAMNLTPREGSDNPTLESEILWL
jgi:hypothetical protein